MKLILDDTRDTTILTIQSGSKTLLVKKGKSIKELLSFVFKSTKNDNLKASIIELQSLLSLYG
jgi:hypothetical protein